MIASKTDVEVKKEATAENNSTPPKAEENKPTALPPVTSNVIDEVAEELYGVGGLSANTNNPSSNQAIINKNEKETEPQIPKPALKGISAIFCAFSRENGSLEVCFIQFSNSSDCFSDLYLARFSIGLL